MTTTTTTTRATRTTDLPLASLQMAVRQFTRAADADAAADPAATAAPAARFELVFTTGAPVRRYDWANGRYYMEQLQVTPESINLDRLQRGAPLLNSHWAWTLEDQIGVVDQPTIEAGQGVCQAQMSRRDSVRGIVQDLDDGVIRNVSVGYTRDAIEMIAPAQDSGMWVYNVTRWTPMEVSLVSMPADMDSQVRSVGGQLQDDKGRQLRSFPCAISEISEAPIQAPQANQATHASTTPEQRAVAPTATAPSIPTAGNPAATHLNPGATMTTADNQRQTGDGNPAVATTTTTTTPSATHADGVHQERQRQADIRTAVQAARSTLGADADALQARLLDSAATVDQARAQVLDALAARSEATPIRSQADIRLVGSELETRRDGLAEAIAHRMDPTQAITDNGRRFRHMSLSRIAEAVCQHRNISTEGMSPMEIAGRAMTTGDLPAIMSNVANKRLRSGYEANEVSYTRWARRAPNAPNFKAVDVLQMSAAPDLLKVNEHGEFTYGKVSDGKESYSVISRGRIIAFTRQMVVNDDLRSLDRMVTGFGASGRRLENRLVYSELTANAVLGNDGLALFEAATHKNLTAVGTAISVASMGVARTAMGLQKGLAGEELNLTPSFLIVPRTQEQLAYQFTSSNYVPATPGTVNEFRAGGRTAVEPIVESLLDANSTTAWYMAANANAVDTVEYCYLDGREGVALETEYSFDMDGMKMRAVHDFAAKAIDFRGLYKNNGA